MTEKHPTANDSEAQESAPQTAQDKLSHIMKDSMTPSDWQEYFRYMMQNELFNTKFSFTSPENIVSFFRFFRAYTEEKSVFDVYSLIRTMLEKNLTVDVEAYAKLDDPDCRELMYKLKDYVDSFQEYIDRLNDRLRAIVELADAVDLIDDPVVKQKVTQKCNDVLDIHEALFFFYNSLEELRLKFEIEKLKYNQKKSNSPDALSDRVTEINDLMIALFGGLGSLAKSNFNQEEKLDRLHELSKESLIGQKEIKGELPPGGIRQLKKLLQESPEKLAKRYGERFSKVTSQLTPAQWKVYSLHRDGESNAKIAKALGYSHPHIGKMLKEIDMVFRANELPSGITFYIQQKRVPSYFLDDDNDEDRYN